MPPRIRVSTAFLTVLLVAGAVIVGPSAVASAGRSSWTPPTRLDSVAPIDVAVSGNTAAWLRPTGRTTTTLMWWSTTTGEAIPTDARLRRDPTRLTLGTDATGQPAVIVEYAKAAPRIYGLRPPSGPQPGGAPPSVIAVVPNPNGQVLPVATTPGDRPHAFGLRDGRISFGRRNGVGRRSRDAIWLGTATSPDARVITRRPREPRRHMVVDTALGTGTRIAYTAILTRGPERGTGASWRIAPERHRPRSLGLFFGAWEGGTSAGSRITVRGDGISAAISVYGSLGDGNGDFLFGFRSGLAWDHRSGDPAWLEVGADGRYTNWRAVERGERPQPNSSLLLDDGGYVGYVANRPFPGFDDHLSGSRLACPRGATKPRCLVWWRQSTGPAPAVPRAP